MPDANVQQAIGSSWLPGSPKALIVDDDDFVRGLIGVAVERSGFRVITASNVKDALRHACSGSFDVLVTDMHMPAPGNGLTVVSAMRHFHPEAVTILLSAFPEMTEAAKTIFKQTDEVLFKPVKIESLIDTITERLKRGAVPPRVVESVATILEGEIMATIEEWLGCVNVNPLATVVPLDDDKRCAHLSQLFRDLIFRLHHPLPLGRPAMVSPAAVAHGVTRYKQGYSAAMMVEESRILKASIFQTLQGNLHKVDFNLLLVSVMAIADEVDSQFSQAMAGYVSEPKAGGATSHANV